MEEKKTIAEDEIDLIELLKVIWAGRRFIFKITAFFTVLGLIVAFTSKVEYEASCKLLPESQEGMNGNLGGLSGLAGLAGINLDMGSAGVLTPELYPEIAKSLPFQLEILRDTVSFETKKMETSSFQYFKEIDKPSLIGYISKYTIGLPGLVKSVLVSNDEKEIEALRESDFIRLSKEDWKLIDSFKERISINVDTKSGIIDVSVEMPDPLAAAHVTNNVVALLTQKVTNYKIDKAKNSLEFVSTSFEDAKKEFEFAQERLAKATDRNRNVASATAQVELQRLQNEYTVAFEVYKGLASQMEQAKIKLKEDTPVFTVLEPVKVPVDKSRPKRMLTLMVFTFLGGLLSCVICLLKGWNKWHR